MLETLGSLHKSFSFTSPTKWSPLCGYFINCIFLVGLTSSSLSWTLAKVSYYEMIPKIFSPAHLITYIICVVFIHKNY